MKKGLLVVLPTALIMAAVSCAGPVSQSTTEYWPDKEWRTSAPEAQGMDSEVLAGMYDAISRSRKQIDCIIVIRNGTMVNEAYFSPYRKGMLHGLNSVTKSIVSALAGMAADAGKIRADDAVLDYFPETVHVDASKQAMKLGDIMSMQTGLDWQFYGDQSTADMNKSADWAQFTLDLPMKEAPGHTFLYSNGAAVVMADIVQDRMGRSAEDLLRSMDIGIGELYWGKSPEGTNRGDAGVFMLPEDMAKFGYLYLNEGNWDGRQLISKEWIEASTTTHAQPDWTPLLPGYGYFWWIPEFGGYCAIGNGGQYIFVVPELDMVAVFVSGLYDNADLFYPVELMRDYVIPSVKSDTPLPENPAALDGLNAAVDGVQNPAPKPVALPDTAEQISGKTIVFDNMVLTMQFDSDTCTARAGDFTYEIGLDGIYRTVDVGNAVSLPDHYHIAFVGGWTDDRTFVARERLLEDGIERVYTLHFDGDQVAMDVFMSFTGQTDHQMGTIE